jgi:hypothetical protein
MIGFYPSITLGNREVVRRIWRSRVSAAQSRFVVIQEWARKAGPKAGPL